MNRNMIYVDVAAWDDTWFHPGTARTDSGPYAYVYTDASMNVRLGFSPEAWDALVAVMGPLIDSIRQPEAVAP